MLVSFKSIMLKVIQTIPKEIAGSPEIYEAINRAIQTLSSEGFTQEKTENLFIDKNGQYAISEISNQVNQTLKIRDPLGYRIKRFDKESIEKLIEAGDPYYAEESGIVYVKPLAALVAKAVTITDDHTIGTSDNFITAGFVVGMKIFLSDSSNAANNDTPFTVATVAEQEMTVTPAELTATPLEEITIGTVYDLVCYEALPEFTSYKASGAGTEIEIDKYFVPAIIDLTIANLAEAKGYKKDGISIADRHRTLYDKGVEKLQLITATMKEKQH